MKLRGEQVGKSYYTSPYMENNMNLNYINHLGSDHILVNISRTCTGKHSKLTQEKVAKLLSNLVRDRHWSVFDHATIQYRIEAPIYVARQWMRHQAAYMERSLRYTKQPKLNELDGYLLNTYHNELAKGTKPEDARKAAPLDTLTEVVITTSLRDAFFLISQRLDSHAQKETRELAGMLLKVLKMLFPLATLAYLEWEYQSFSVSVYELEAIVNYMNTGNIDEETYPSVRGFIDNAKKRIKSVGREAEALKEPRQDSEADVGDTQLQFDFGEEIL